MDKKLVFTILFAFVAFIANAQFLSASAATG